MRVKTILQLANRKPMIGKALKIKCPSVKLICSRCFKTNRRIIEFYFSVFLFFLNIVLSKVWNKARLQADACVRRESSSVVFKMMELL